MYASNYAHIILYV